MVDGTGFAEMGDDDFEETLKQARAHFKRNGGSGGSAQRIVFQSSAEFINSFVPPDPLIDGILQRQYIYAITGHTGRGKTAIALLFAACIALGRRIGKLEVEKGHVLYLAGENPVDVQMRWLAMSTQMNFDIKTIDVHFVRERFKLAEEFEVIAQKATELGGLDLIIVDSSAAFFEGDDENNNPQQGRHAARFRLLTKILGGPCVLMLCHPTKNAPDDNLQPRGAGSFVAEIDGNLTVVKTDNIVTLHWQTKFRGPDFAPVEFLLRSATHERLKDTKGRQITTVIAEHLTSAEHEEMDKGARDDEDLVLRAINEQRGISVAEIAEHFRWFHKDGTTPYKSKVQRIVDKLKNSKLIRKEGRCWTLTDNGKKILEEISK